jgi:predicted glutamine amidotransferase
LAEYESRNETVRYREKYPYSYDEKDRYIKYDINNPSYISFRRYKTEPQEGHDSCHPSHTVQRVRLDVYNMVITKPPAQTRTDADGDPIPCR